MLSQATIVHRLTFVLAVAWLIAGCASGPSYPQSGSGTEKSRSAMSASAAAKVALEQIGSPYRYGGDDRSGFDCSGMVHYSYLQIGKQVPRTTHDLWRQSRPVSVANLQVGDILFFKIDGKMSHVGMYLGDGRFVHAPSTGKRVTIARLDSTFYQQAFVRGGRF